MTYTVENYRWEPHCGSYTVDNTPPVLLPTACHPLDVAHCGVSTGYISCSPRDIRCGICRGKLTVGTSLCIVYCGQHSSSIVTHSMSPTGYRPTYDTHGICGWCPHYTPAVHAPHGIYLVLHRIYPRDIAPTGYDKGIHCIYPRDMRPQDMSCRPQYMVSSTPYHMVWTTSYLLPTVYTPQD